jgi:hypothetical protein
MTIDQLVQDVVDGEGGSGGVYVSGFNQETGGEPYLVGVCTDSQLPTYESDILGTPENIKAAEAALDKAGMSVFTDPEEWEEQLEKWFHLGGGVSDEDEDD